MSPAGSRACPAGPRAPYADAHVSPAHEAGSRGETQPRRGVHGASKIFTKIFWGTGGLALLSQSRPPLRFWLRLFGLSYSGPIGARAGPCSGRAASEPQPTAFVLLRLAIELVPAMLPVETPTWLVVGVLILGLSLILALSATLAYVLVEEPPPVVEARL